MEGNVIAILVIIAGFLGFMWKVEREESRYHKEQADKYRMWLYQTWENQHKRLLNDHDDADWWKGGTDAE